MIILGATVPINAIPTPSITRASNKSGIPVLTQLNAEPTATEKSANNPNFQLPYLLTITPTGIESRIETNAELTDDVVFVVDGVGIVVFKIKAAALGDGAKVVFEVFGGHANAGVFDGDGARIFVRGEANIKIILVEGAGFIGEGLVINLVDGVGRIRDKLAQENFAVGVNRMNH